ncbi:MAG: cell division septal protein FtsQ [Lentimonas sp.]|jgi:cell division septal protein FtsQ
MIGSGKQKGSTEAGGAQSWRELAGQSRSRVQSPKAKRRRLRKWVQLLLVAMGMCVLGAGVSWSVIHFKHSKDIPQIYAPSQPLQRVLFNTDGVLSETWLRSVIDLHVNLSMMDIDIFALKEKLEAQGQVKSAAVERVFPGDLILTIEERAPLLRLVSVDSHGKQQVRIVARDGAVYTGVDYPKTMLQRLPYVLPYRYADGSYFPMRGMDRVAELVEYARNNSPEILDHWQVISLSHYSGDMDQPGQVIEVRSRSISRIIFSASGDYGQQVDRLKYVLAYIRERGNQSIARVDLSLLGSAAVQFTSGTVGRY